MSADVGFGRSFYRAFLLVTHFLGNVQGKGGDLGPERLGTIQRRPDHLLEHGYVLLSRLGDLGDGHELERDRKSTRLNSSHLVISYAVFCLKKSREWVELSGGTCQGSMGSRG